MTVTQPSAFVLILVLMKSVVCMLLIKVDSKNYNMLWAKTWQWATCIHWNWLWI